MQLHCLRRGWGALVLAMFVCPAARAEWSWIWSSDPAINLVELRREFTVPTGARRANLMLASDNEARVFLNGQEVVQSESWEVPSTANVTSAVRPGANAIRVEARNEGGPAGFVARLRIRTDAGEAVILETDESWQVRSGGVGEWQPAKAVGRYGDEPWGDTFGLGIGRPLVVQPDAIRVLPGFRVELLHVVTKAEEGSWVSLTVDDRGRILACDQHGGLYRLEPSAVGSGEPGRVERLDTGVGGAHGLLCAFDSLYVMVNEQSGRQGLWRLRDTDGDDHFDQEEQLRRIDGSGEHGPHAVVSGPDGESIYVVCGNHTRLPEGLELSRAPRRWAEDHIIPRLWDANGHARGILAPGGAIYRTDPDGRIFEMVSHGYRNAYDFAFNDLGDIITYDSDMEWDAGLPWYRPTRICLATSGSELGWRSGSGKWPSYYPDSLPALLDIGPGSPTGLEAGRNAKFPARYQSAVFANDWTYGTMYAIHLEPDGAAYRATREEFVSGQPLPLTDLVVNPRDGALYFAIGGRRTQSAVYRVSYTGTESVAPVPAPALTPAHQLRRQLEQLHLEGTGPEAIEIAWPHLAHSDRWIRFAARVAVERQPYRHWSARAMSETRPLALIELGIALAHLGDAGVREGWLERLGRLDFQGLDEAGQLSLVRVYQLILLRFGLPESAAKRSLIDRLDREFPARSAALNRELAATLIALDAPAAVPKTLQLLAVARDEDIDYGSAELLGRNLEYAKAFSEALASRPNVQQIAYAYVLRVAQNGWSPALRRAYFDWFPRTAPWQGGNSFRGFIENIRQEALANVSDAAERQALGELSSRPGVPMREYPLPKGPGRDYTVADVLSLAEGAKRGRDFENGRAMFHSTACYACHRFDGSGGGLGPDLTTAAARFSLRDLVENIVEPSQVISDQYGSESVELTDGTMLIGRAYEEKGRLHVVYDPRNPDEREEVDLARVRTRRPYPVSFMPTGLLNGLNPEEVLDLLGYVLSGGDREHEMFKADSAGR